MSIFESNIFMGHRVGYGNALGMLPDSAEPISALRSQRSRYPTLPSDAELRSKGVSHFAVGNSKFGGTFMFFDDDGEVIVGPITLYAGGAGPVRPAPTKGAPVSARREGDGLLPGSSAPVRASEPKVLPWLLLGGGVLVASGIVYTATRRKKRVAANKRRRRRRTSR